MAGPNTLNCPSCGGDDISALAGGALKCRHCGTTFTDPARNPMGSAPVHVHLHAGAPVVPPMQYAPPPMQYAPPPIQYMPPPVYIQAPPQQVVYMQAPAKRKTSLFTWIVLASILMCFGLAIVPLLAGSRQSPSSAALEPGLAGTTPAPDAESQWKELYKPGAVWIMHIQMGVEMWQKTEVISVDGTRADITVFTKMKSDEEFANPVKSIVEYKTIDAKVSPDSKYKELAKGEEKVRDWDTTWIESEYDGAKSKVWTSKRFGSGLTVRMENAQGVMELIEFTKGK